MPPFRYQTNFVTRLGLAVGASDPTFQVTSVPANLPSGRYPLRFGTNPFTSEWLAADYPGSGTTFTNAERIGEGSNPPRAWAAGTPVACVLTGEAFESLGDATANVTPYFHPELYVRPAAARVYLAAKFN